MCIYDKRYYCRACFGNYAYCIPSKIIYNWDHNKYRGNRDMSYDDYLFCMWTMTVILEGSRVFK